MQTTQRSARVALVLALGVMLAGAGNPDDATPPPGQQEVTVVGVLADPRGQHGVLLESKRDQRRVLMAIGAPEAVAIAVPLEHITPPRPLTHDLFLTLFGRLKVSITKVVITDLRNNIYYATVYLAAGGTPMELDARPSDAR